MPIITQTRANVVVVKNFVGFTPKNPGNCVLWLDGKDPAGNGVQPSNGDTVTTWVDKSSSMKNGTYGGNPTYLSGGGINFNGTSYFLNTSFAFNLSQRTLFVVMQENSHAINRGIMTFIPDPTNQADYDSTTGLSVETTNGFRVYGNGYSSDIGNSTLLAKAIYMNSMNGTAGSSYLNATNINNSSGSLSGTCSGYGVSTRWVSGVLTSLGLVGVIYEILLFNTTLNDSDRKDIEGYLAQKWNLTSSLPAGHPGLSGDYSEPRRLPDTNAITFIQKPGLQYHSSAIFPTYIISNATANLLFHLDAGNPASYSGSGSTWNDLAGSGLTTELFGSPDYISANGGYLSFTPPSQYGQTSASLSVLTTFTVEVWHYFDGTYTGGQPCILTEVFTGPMNFFLGSLDGATAPQLQFGYFPNAWNITQPPYTIPANGWYHIVGTYDGTSVKLYMNNILIRSNDYSTTPSSSGGGIRFMRRWDNPDYWGGGLAIVRIYSVGLTANQVTVNFNSDKGRFGLS